MIAALAAITLMSANILTVDPPVMRGVEVVENFDTPSGLYIADGNAPSAVAQHQRALKVNFLSVGNGSSGPIPINNGNSWVSVKSPPGMLMGQTSDPQADDYIRLHTDGSSNKYLYRKLSDSWVWFTVPPSQESGYSFSTNIAFWFHYPNENPPVDVLQQFLGTIARVNALDAAIDSRKTFGWPNTDGTWSEIQANAPRRPVNFGAYTYRGGLFVGQMTGGGKDRSGVGRTQFYLSTEVPTENSSGQDFMASCLTAYCSAHAQETATGPVTQPPTNPEPPTLPVRAHVATAESSELSSLSITQKENAVTWRNRWSIGETAVAGEALGTATAWMSEAEMDGDSTNESFKKLYCWKLTKIQSSGNAWDTPCPSLGALLAHNESTYNGNNVWYYFGSKEWLAQKAQINQALNDCRARFITYHDATGTGGANSFPSSNFPP